MFKTNRLSPVEQARLQRQKGSAPYSPESRGAENPSSFVQSYPIRSRWFPNADWLWRQFRNEGAIEYDRHGHLYGNQAARDVHRDNNQTQSDMYGSDNERIVMDARHEREAQAFLRNHGVYEYMKSSNAVEACGYFYDQMLSRIGLQIKDDELRAATKAELQTMFNQAIAEIRIISFGNQFDPERGSYGDQF